MNTEQNDNRAMEPEIKQSTTITQSFNNTSINLSAIDFRGNGSIQTGYRLYGGHQEQTTLEEGDIPIERTKSTVLARKCLFTDEEIYATESRAINQQFAKVI